MRSGRISARIGHDETSADAITVVTTIAMAAPAYADPASDTDAEFLSELKAAGITFQDPAAAISAAKDVCQLVDKGPGVRRKGRRRVHGAGGRILLPQVPDR
jgi:Protein of unknown function (DUF732)